MQNIASFTDLEAWIARVWQGQRVLIKPWFVVFEFGSISNGASADVTQKINSNADFVLVDYRLSIDAPSNELKIQFVDNGSLERFFADSVPFPSIGKTNAFGFQSVSTYRRIAGNSSITASIENNTGGARTPIVTMAGVLVYPYSAARG